MHLTHKAAQAAITAIAAACLWAPTAMANPVEVSDNGVHCTPVVPAGSSGHQVQGGCHLEAVSLGDITTEVRVLSPPIHVFGPTCEIAMEIRLDEAGEGYLQHIQFISGDMGCGNGLRACNEAEAHDGGNGPWPVHLEEISFNQEIASIELCLIVAGVGRCEGPVQLSLSKFEEQYFAELDEYVPCGTPNVRFELSGEFVLLNEEGEEVHIIHPIE